MNQAQLAELLDVSLATISRICSGERRPSLDLMLKIEEVLEWPIDEQANEVRCEAYCDAFRRKMEERDVDASAVRGVPGTGSGDGVPALETDQPDRPEDRVGERPSPVDKLDISDRWYPR